MLSLVYERETAIPPWVTVQHMNRKLEMFLLQAIFFKCKTFSFWRLIFTLFFYYYYYYYYYYY